MRLLAKAIAIVSHEFKHKLDKGGQPYVLHCLHVMNTCGLTDEDGLCAAVMHDLLEDIPHWTVKTLFDEGFSVETVELCNILRHNPEESYLERYIKKIASYPKAVAIKKADLRHNSDITRMKDVTSRDFGRLEKYHIAYKYLSKI